MITKNLRFLLFNLKEKIHHAVTSDEAKLIKETHLFDTVNEENLQNILCRIRLVKYPAGKVIVKKGEQGGALYVISEGSVRAYNYDLNGIKIPLARLNKGDYFGEQALVGGERKIRNANVETITDTTLIEIRENSINEFKDSIKLNVVFRRFGFYEHMTSIVSKIDSPRILELDDQQTIFNKDDKPDYFYIILSGKVTLLIPDLKTGKLYKSVLHEKHIFGELGVIENKPRLGTAVANGKVRLLALDKEDLNKYFSGGNDLQSILTMLKKSYHIPHKGIVEQFFGKDDTIGPHLTTQYHLEDGREAISKRSLNQDLFQMSQGKFTKENWYSFVRDHDKIEINIADGHLIQIRAKGIWEQLPNLCHLLLNDEPISDAALKKFELTGQIEGPKIADPDDDAKIVCDCMSVTKKQIKDLIQEGAAELSEIINKTGASTSCGACRFRVLEMLGVSGRLSALMKKDIEHSSYINSYTIKLIRGQFKDYKAGHHIVLQVKIGDEFIERPYTISGIDREKGQLQVTIKKEPKGYFTGWLFGRGSDEIEIKVTQPQGNFTFNTDHTKNSLCFAGGIGITPFIAFARVIALEKLPIRAELVYTALTKEDFIFTQEFNAISAAAPHFTVRYKATNTEGFLTENEIIEAVNALNQPEIYICGPKPYLLLIQNTLKKVNYDPNKIHFEEFLHAGGK